MGTGRDEELQAQVAAPCYMGGEEECGWGEMGGSVVLMDGAIL